MEMWLHIQLEIVTDSVNLLGFRTGSNWVRVRVEIFYPNQIPYSVHRFSGYWCPPTPAVGIIVINRNTRADA
jgi:hypothetical protein